MLSISQQQRYNRQLLLKEFGAEAQEKLLEAKILVVGAGGLGCPALQYLAAAGVGNIGIVDFDTVELSNLQRQILYTVDDIGKPKASTAAKKIKDLNPEISVTAYDLAINSKNALDLMPEYDLVLDGSDNFSTRYMLNDACCLLNKPLIYGAVLRFEGQVAVFHLKNADSGIVTNYRDLFPVPPEPATVLSCNEAGVLGVLPGIIGTLQATEAIKIICGLGAPLAGILLNYNALINSFYQIEIAEAQKKDLSYPKNREEFLNFDYAKSCEPTQAVSEISTEEFEHLRGVETLHIVDVRERGELPGVDEFEHVKLPITEFNPQLSLPETNSTLVFFCNSGIRSKKAVQKVKKLFPKVKAYSLAGGIVAWKQLCKIHL